ncbi:MAG: mechanosensitive ion channel family protein [Pseudomonadales bacterium]|jgi:MscS family membrane protein
MEMNSLLTQLGLKGDGLLVVEVFIVVFVTVLANFVALYLLKQIVRHIEKTHNYWDDALILAARKPLSVLIWLLGISWAADIVAANTDAVIFDAIGPVREVSVILLLAWFLVGFIQRTEAALMDPQKVKEPFDETTVTAIGKLLRVSVIITAALILMQTLGYSISGILAFGGVGGIAVGFAAKDLLANFFGGLMIYLDRPFTVGDWIRSPDREIEGTVEKIGWRLTSIRTFEKRPLYVPNSTFTNITVENPSRMTNRRIYETIGLRYDDAAQLKGIVGEVKDMLLNHPEIDTDKTLIVNFNAFGESSLDFFIYTFTKTTDWIHFHEIKQDVLMKVLDIIEARGADVAYPTSTVHLPDRLHLDAPAELPIEPVQRKKEA